MEEKSDHEEQKRPVSVLQDEGFCTNRILARETSVGQSSRIFYRAAEGVPFKWEMQPGTPKDPQEEDAIPPLSPSPLMQSFGLPLPNLDCDELTESPSKRSRIGRLRKMVKERMEIVLGGRRRSKEEESSRFGDSNGELLIKDSSFSSNSSSSSFSPDSCVMDTSTIDGAFCCSPWNVPAILEEGNTTIYYCSQHKAAFAVEEDASFLSRILSRVSAGDQFSGPLNTDIPPAGVPFRWEMHPGTPKQAPEDELIPPPSPPPALQSLSLPQPRLQAGGEKAKKSKRAWFCKLRSERKEETEKEQHEISFRYNDNVNIISRSDKEIDASFGESGSVSSASSVAPLSKGGDRRVSKSRRNFQGGYFSCGPWRKRDILVFAWRKLKSFTS